MTAMNGAPGPEGLRALVREVLRDVLPDLAVRDAGQPAARPQASAAWPSSGPQGRADFGPPARPPTSDPVHDHPIGVTRAAGASGAGHTPVAGEPSGIGAAGPGVTLRAVRLVTDEDLRAFVHDVIRLAGNPKRRRDLLAGRLRFTLAPDAPASGAAAPPYRARPGSGPAAGPSADRGPTAPAGGDHRIGRGAVTERAVQAAADAGARLVLGPRAILTPLARDRARVLGVAIEKER